MPPHLDPPGRLRPVNPRRLRVPAALLLVSAVLTACTSTPDAAPTGQAGGSPTLTTPSPSRQDPPSTPATGMPDLSALSGQIEGSLQRNGIPGAVVLIRSPWTGTWVEAFGTRSAGEDDPVTTDDVFRLADITATMTAAVMVKLHQEGRLSLTDPISQYVDGVPGGDELTLEALGEYRSGLYSYDQDPDFRAGVAADPGRVWTPQELLDIAFSHPTVSTDRFNYSNTDYVLLGLVIEKVTGLSAAEAFRTMLFDPIGVTGIGLSTDTALPDPHPNGHTFAVGPDAVVLTEDRRAAAADGSLLPEDRSTLHPSSLWTAGGAYGTATAVADFFTAVVDGPLVDAATRAEWDSEVRSGVETPDGVRHGLGMATRGDYHLYGGQMDGFSSLVAHSPELRTTVVVLTNLGRNPNGGSPVAEIHAAVLQQLDDLATLPPLELPGSATDSPTPTR